MNDRVEYKTKPWEQIFGYKDSLSHEHLTFLGKDMEVRVYYPHRLVKYHGFRPWLYKSIDTLVNELKRRGYEIKPYKMQRWTEKFRSYLCRSTTHRK